MLTKALSALVVAASLVACAGQPVGPGLAPNAGSNAAGPVTFGAPPSSDVFRRALRTDMCALLDEAALAELGWSRGSGQLESFTSCGGGTADLRQSVGISLDTAVSEQDVPATADRCTRLRIIDRTTMVALKVQARASGDVCTVAGRFLATAVQRFDGGDGAGQPPNGWLVLDACELLPPLLLASAAGLGEASPALREVRRLGARACIATHLDGEVTLSVAPVAGRPEELDGQSVAVAGRAARTLELPGLCVLRLIGQPLGNRTQVITVEVQAQLVPAAQRCAVATAMVQALLPALPAS